MSSASTGFAELIKPKITEDHQVLAALASTGAGFEALGGSTLMLTEPVENSVDSIIEASKSGIKVKGIIRIFIDKDSEQVVIADNGLGFTNPRHICERPFDSLKKYDPDLTGKFARGLQGFRSYCQTLVFVTRRLQIPSGETFGGKSGHTVRLEFKAERPEISAEIVSDKEFELWSWSDFNHGAVAFYRDWKAGEFAKIRKEKLVRRIERHFGELIRKGQIEILIWEGTGLKLGKRIDRKEFYECKPRDYSEYKRIDIPPVAYVHNGQKVGEIMFELYLTNRAKSDRDLLPFLMYKDRPVGDAPVALIGEFAESDVWNSSYLTGFIRADFCEINELRLALKPGPSRDFLYQNLEGTEDRLREEIRKHHRGLIDIRRSQEINQLVNKLQSFLKSKKIFDFKLARELGDLATGDKPQRVEVTAAAGSDESRAALQAGGELVTAARPIEVVPRPNIVPGEQPAVYQGQKEVGGAGGSRTETLEGGPGAGGAKAAHGESGYVEQAAGLNKGLPTLQQSSLGTSGDTTGRIVRRRRPRGFNISLQEDEFSEELSSFDPVNSTVIINSGHERYKKRDNPDDPTNKELLAYMSELYIWEICRLAAKNNPELNLTDTFLKTKFEFFEAS